MCASAVSRSAKAREFALNDDESAALARADWKPVFLNAHQNDTLIALSDGIIPATETPGAKAALVNRFLDLVLSAEPLPAQHAFLASLAYLDTASMERYKAPFASLTPEERDNFLGLLAYPRPQSTFWEPEEKFAGYEHFVMLKEWIAGAFYSSPIGLKELGWDGSSAHGVFSGCQHSPGEHESTT